MASLQHQRVCAITNFVQRNARPLDSPKPQRTKRAFLLQHVVRPGRAASHVFFLILVLTSF